MGKLKDTPIKNLYGDGYQQEYIDDNGDRYIIKNSAMKNLYGDGNQKIIEKVDSGRANVTEKDMKDMTWIWVSGVLGILTLFSFMANYGESSIITWGFFIAFIGTGIYAIIRCPSWFGNLLKVLIVCAIFLGIIFLPLLPEILRCSRF